MIERPTSATPTPDEAAPVASSGVAATLLPTRLHLEQDGGRYLYRVVDVATGRLLLEVPREGVGLLKTLQRAST